MDIARAKDEASGFLQTSVKSFKMDIDTMREAYENSADGSLLRRFVMDQIEAGLGTNYQVHEFLSLHYVSDFWTDFTNRVCRLRENNA